MQVRAYDESDWPAVLPIVRAVVDDGRTYAYDPAWTDAELHDVWVGAAPDRTLVAIDGDTVLGTAKTGPNRPGAGSHVATASFMVSAAARGRGVGRSLADEVLRLARADGYAAMQFNAVVETNHAAVALWTSLGFAIVGTVPEAFRHPDHGLVGLHVMHRRL